MVVGLIEEAEAWRRIARRVLFQDGDIVALGEATEEDAD